MSELIFHHYPQSPVAEKVRAGFGIKNLTWRSVEIPRIPPKPDLMPLTGGYRRTPVMQFGADIFCDSQAILRELERRYPEPTFFPQGEAGRGWGLSRWTDGELFPAMIKVVLATTMDQIPENFVKDRTRLYFGEDVNLQDVLADIPHQISQIKAQLGWMDQQLAAGPDYMSGDKPGLSDTFCYYLVWFLRGRWEGGPGLLSEFPALEAWEKRLRDMGHGSSSDMSSEEALDIAAATEPAFAESVDATDPTGLSAGQQVGVTPDEDGGDPVVTGRLHILNADSVALLRDDDRVGTVCVHFPRVGYRITADQK